MTHEASETEIVAFLRKKQNREALNLMMDAYSNLLFSHIYKMMNGRDGSEDILQNTFVKAWKYLDSFNQQSKVSTWLFRIATNETLTFIKKEKKHLVGKSEMVVHQGTVEHDYTSKEIENLLAKALEQLPPKQRQVFVLRYYDEMKYQEMSELLETSESSLKTSYHIAVKKIESFLKGD